MAEFLVTIEFEDRSDPDDPRQKQVLEAEAARSRELIEQGFVRRLWRVPGRRANIGIWEAADATALHEAISSLPLYRSMRVRIEPLARHPLDDVCRGMAGPAPREPGATGS